MYFSSFLKFRLEFTYKLDSYSVALSKRFLIFCGVFELSQISAESLIVFVMHSLAVIFLNASRFARAFVLLQIRVIVIYEGSRAPSGVSSSYLCRNVSRSVHLFERFWIPIQLLGRKKQRASLPSMRAARPVERLRVLAAAVFVGFRKRSSSSVLEGRVWHALKNAKIWMKRGQDYFLNV